ncbi:hypothetical protein FACS1894130_02370 [Spirochaetia bacterium]|nr:hypothetical protein FACS1894130_02370 [Spirochaetia bacterium]
MLSVGLAPEFFSPDGDGENDELFATLGAEDESGIESWMIRIYEPNSTDKLFYEMSAQGAPPSEAIWDGRSNINGELVQSASDYSWTFSATDTAGNESAIHGSIETGDWPPIKIDILVIREGDILRAQVPSIVFGANSGGFTGLDADVIKNNEYIIERIAAALNKFETYKVQVEGHTNPLARTQRERQREQITDQRLSIQRAQTVVDHLVALGVDSSRFNVVGIGGARPIAPYENRDDWWKNRRVEFILIK